MQATQTRNIMNQGLSQKLKKICIDQYYENIIAYSEKSERREM